MPPWDSRVRAALKSGKQMTGLWSSWEYAMRDADTMSRYFLSRVRVGKLDTPYCGMSWYVLQTGRDDKR